MGAFQAIEQFLRTSGQPAVMEPGEDAISVGTDNFRLERNGARVTFEVWSETHNLVRRVRAVHSERRGRLELDVEHFGGRIGRLTLVDLAHPSSRDASRQGARLKYRERFRRSLSRQFPDWRIVELSTAPDLHHTLSPSFPRALLRKGNTAMAAIGAAEDSLDPDGALTFGLIWLDYLRHRETRLAVRGLAIFLPEGHVRTACHRVRYLDPSIAAYTLFAHFANGTEEPIDPRDHGNFDTRIEPCKTALAGYRTELADWVERIAKVEDVERRDQPDGSVILAVRGLEFARASGGRLTFGIDQKHEALDESHVREIEALARGVATMRNVSRVGQGGPLYTRRPEAWLESQVRTGMETLDASLLPCPLYGQVPQFAAGERGILDILAVDRDGRLAIVEVKATQDVHLPLQALDYWMRVKWHLERGEFRGRGYFPGTELRTDPPRLLLVAPALDFHPTNEVLLRYFSPEVEIERLGVGLQWRQELRVMFRDAAPQCRSPFSAKSDRVSPI